MIETRGPRRGSRSGSVLLIAIGLAVLLTGLAACSAAGPTLSALGSPAGTVTSGVASPSPTLDPPTSTPQPTASATFTPWPTLPATPTPRAVGTWTLNVYSSKAVRYQDPDLTACVATSTQIMLNMSVLWSDYTPLEGAPKPVKPENWKVDTTYDKQKAVLAYARKNTTQVLTDGGADAHGWRNALNYYGWGHNNALVFKDLTYTTFDAAAKAAVSSLALYRKPVGILAWAGQHAQIVNGYKVTGEDPRSGSTKFTIVGVYVTDPLKSDGYRNAYIPLATWRSGGKHIRFTTYQMTNSPYVDPIDGHQGNAEWDGKWTIVAPVA